MSESRTSPSIPPSAEPELTANEQALAQLLVLTASVGAGVGILVVLVLLALFEGVGVVARNGAVWVPTLLVIPGITALLVRRTIRPWLFRQAIVRDKLWNIARTGTLSTATSTDNDDPAGLTCALAAATERLRENALEINVHRGHLRSLVDQRTSALRDRDACIQRVYDAVPVAIVTIGPDGAAFGPRSALFERWFGTLDAQSHLAPALGRLDPTFGHALRQAWEPLFADQTPASSALAQLPTRIQVNAVAYAVVWRLVEHEGKRSGVQAFFTHITPTP